MTIFETIIIAICLGADAFSVSTSIGCRWHGRRQRFRLAWHMGLFQFLMPIIGFYAGSLVKNQFQSIGDYISAGIILLIGLKMLVDSVKEIREKSSELDNESQKEDKKDPTKGKSLVFLSIAVSLDALFIGLSFGIKEKISTIELLYICLVIGVIAGIMSLSGILIGKKIGEKVGKYAELVGACLLIGVGIFMLF